MKKITNTSTLKMYNSNEIKYSIIDTHFGCDYDCTHTTFNNEVDAFVHIHNTIYTYCDDLKRIPSNSVILEITPFNTHNAREYIDGVDENGERVKTSRIFVTLLKGDKIIIEKEKIDNNGVAHFYNIATVTPKTRQINSIDYSKVVARTRNSATANLTAQHKAQMQQRTNDYQATAKARQIEKAQQRKDNTHKQQRAPITADNINGVAKAVAINKLRFLERVSPNAYISKLIDQARYGYSKASDDLKKCIVQYAVASGDEFSTMDDIEQYMHTHDQRKALDDLNESEKQYAIATANDFDDLVQCAALALWENLVSNGGAQCTDDAFLIGLKAVENQINASRRNLVEYSFTITKNEKGDIVDRKVKTRIMYKHLYIDEYAGDDEDGQPIFEIKDINNNIAQYIKGVMDNDTINEVLAICTPLQREIIKRVALGNTYESIARVLGISVSKVKRHYNAIKEKARAEINRY